MAINFGAAVAAATSQPSENSKLWVQLASTARPFKLVAFPRKDATGEPIGQIHMRVLTQAEQMTAAARAEQVARSYMKSDAPKMGETSNGYEAVYKNAAAAEVLLLACKDTDAPERNAFPSSEMIRQKLTADEIGVLLSAYLTVQLELGPIVAHMSKEDMDAWVERLALGGSALPLAFLPSELVSDLVMHLVSRLQNLQTDNGSAGSQQDEPTSSNQADDVDRIEVVIPAVEATK